MGGFRQALLWAMPLLVLAPFFAHAEERVFPTGEIGATVTYLDVGGRTHPSGCIVSITVGLPALAVAFSLFSNNSFTVMVASRQSMPHVAIGSDATLKVDSTYIFSKVRSVDSSGTVYAIALTPTSNASMQTAYDAIHQIVVHGARIDAVADDAQIGPASIPKMPGLAPALEACQRYLVEHL